MNRLAKEKSPYLLQHAYNPVDWYPWSDEAFDKAAMEDKPIFLSIGYSTCHWCHVMERESFEDEEVAELLNQYFVSIKVDREERPDIDHLYMSVCQAMTGQGGWPLTIIMTPDKKPFFAGTYFPKHDKWGRPGLLSILQQMHEKWTEERDKINRVSNKITDMLKPRVSATTPGELITVDTLHDAFHRFERAFDERYGGFGQAPKFPTPHNLMFLLRYAQQHENEKALQMVEKSLDAMYRGGIYDHIGYGFARYSTDEKWLVPHFEKMLYDNALLAMAYTEAYQMTKKPFYKKVVEEIFTYVLRDMQSAEGAFYSAEDADSEGEEGKFYVWTPEEIKEVLGEQEGESICRYYGITEGGNFEGKNIPNLIDQSIEDFTRRNGHDEEEWDTQLQKSKEKLFQYREKRVHPHKDDKVLTSWNGLMIAALARASRVFNKSEWAEAASASVRFIENHLVRSDGRLLARYRDGEAAYPAYIDDYAFLVWGLLELYEADFSPKYLQQAIQYNQRMIDLFWDGENGGFFFYGKDSEQLFARPKEVYDGATPSGNSVAALNMLRLSRITGNQQFEDLAEKQIKAFAGEIAEHPSAYSYFLMAAQFAIGPTKEIVIAGTIGEENTENMMGILHSMFLPLSVLILHDEINRREIVDLIPFIKDQKMKDGKATAYVCENFSCQSPVTESDQLKEILGDYFPGKRRK